ncbi:unnamed protein product [Parnassius apollo]|uniref:(apollo) hypothetical protein n=1 Tax=Parnassius apollo TaxID=110799 RepID=A0A8S3XQJ0_PARAO|nr:unnamed protein product [Parnassius apollo]
MPSHEDPESIENTVPFSGMKDIFSGILAHAKPLDYFELFLTRDILEEVVDQTNLYAAQQSPQRMQLQAAEPMHGSQ